MLPKTSAEEPGSTSNDKSGSSAKASMSPQVNDMTDGSCATKPSTKSKVCSGSADVKMPLFASAGAASSKQDNLEGLQVSKKASASKSKGANTSKISQGRQKPIASKYAVLTKELQTGLEKDDGVVINCMYLARNGKATYDGTSKYFNHILHLRSSLPFTLIQSNLLIDSPYKNHVALIIRQETPFRILSLPLDIRTKIYTLVLTPTSSPISITLRKTTRGVYSPTYACPHALSLLILNKQINTESAPILYAHPFAFPSTLVVADFLHLIAHNILFLRTLHSETYTTKSARLMFTHLSTARSLETLSFEHISSNETPTKAVKNLWADGGAWMAGLDKTKPTKALDVLRFGEKAFHVREKIGEEGWGVTCWGPGEQVSYELSCERERGLMCRCSWSS